MKLAHFRIQEKGAMEREAPTLVNEGHTPDKKAPAGEDRRALLTSEGA